MLRCVSMLCQSLALSAVDVVCMEEDSWLLNVWSRRDKIGLVTLPTNSLSHRSWKKGRRLRKCENEVIEIETADEKLMVSF